VPYVWYGGSCWSFYGLSLCQDVVICDLVACEYMSKCVFVLDAIYIKVWKKICNGAAHFFTKTGVKLQRTQISKGKIARVMLSFHNKVNTVNCSSQNRGRGYLRFEITGVKSQSWKNRGKITIRVHSRGKITNLPFSFVIYHNMCGPLPLLLYLLNWLIHI
jgi:hypothetical protein